MKANITAVKLEALQVIYCSWKYWDILHERSWREVKMERGSGAPSQRTSSAESIYDFGAGGEAELIRGASSKFYLAAGVDHGLQRGEIGGRTTN